MEEVSLTEAAWSFDAPVVVVTGLGDAFDHAAAALVEKCGFPVRIVPERRLATLAPQVVIFRDEVQLARLRRVLRGHPVTWIGMVPPPSLATVSGRSVTWLGGDRIELDLDAVLRGTLGAPSASQPVSMTAREREIVGTYVLGSTAAKTAAEHYVAPSTVKTHYSRVSQRYTDAGRPVDNRTQLLLEMLIDGWIRLPRR
jgi:DNA-binding CsgD family transcriptional regulator